MLPSDEVAALIHAHYRVAAVGEPELVVLARAATGRVAWKVPVAVVPLQGHFFVWLDAESGAVMKEAPAGFDQAITELPRREEADR
jgi:hypothetical protein